MFGKTPPEAMVTVPKSLDNSSSLRMASWMWRGTMRDFLLSRAALPASSSTSAARYSYAHRNQIKHTRQSRRRRFIPHLASPRRVSSPPPLDAEISKTHHDSRHVHRRTGTDARRVLASLQVSRDATDRELQPSLGGSAHRLLASLSFTSSGHRRLASVSADALDRSIDPSSASPVDG